ncbi:hypothetical protein MC885_002918 [Smutsia gigantea]|nr:hypothetical protein MC885_002918 [Smutsia gigantea]
MTPASCETRRVLTIGPDGNAELIMGASGKGYVTQLAVGVHPCTSQQLINHIEQFLDTNETLYFMKSMDCIRAFREEAIQFSEEQRFNDFLKTLREKVEIKQLNHFWEIVIQDGITLITKDEASGSSITAEEAKKFLAPKDNPNEGAAAVFEEGGDIDDLVDLI